MPGVGIIRKVQCDSLDWAEWIFIYGFRFETPSCFNNESSFGASLNDVIVDREETTDLFARELN